MLLVTWHSYLIAPQYTRTHTHLNARVCVFVCENCRIFAHQNLACQKLLISNAFFLPCSCHFSHRFFSFTLYSRICIKACIYKSLQIWRFCSCLRFHRLTIVANCSEMEQCQHISIFLQTVNTHCAWKIQWKLLCFDKIFSAFFFLSKRVAFGTLICDDECEELNIFAVDRFFVFPVVVFFFFFL